MTQAILLIVSVMAQSEAYFLKIIDFLLKYTSLSFQRHAIYSSIIPYVPTLSKIVKSVYVSPPKATMKLINVPYTTFSVSKVSKLPNFFATPNLNVNNCALYIYI